MSTVTAPAFEDDAINSLRSLAAKSRILFDRTMRLIAQGGTTSEVVESINEAEPVVTVEKVDYSIQKATIDKIFQDAECELEEYSEYQVGWDGYNGIPFSKEVLHAASEILSIAKTVFERELASPREIMPGPASDGSVDLEIRFVDKIARFTIYPNEDKLRVYIKSRNMRREEGWSLDRTLVEKLAGLAGS